jgi:hypothetical protein
MGNVFAGDDCEGALNPEARWSFTITENIPARVRAGFILGDPRFDLWGFSGGGQFVHRFMVFRPDAPVRIAIAAGSGWYTAPDLVIDCPYGLDDPSLDFTQQDLLAWTNRDMIIMVGTADTLRDPDLRVTPRADAQGLNRYQRADYMVAKGLAANPATRWQRIDVPGVGHEAEPMAEAAQDVLISSAVDVPAPAEPMPPEAETAPTLRVHPNPVRDATLFSGTGWTGADRVEISVYDLHGRRVGGGATRAGRGAWQIPWSGLGSRGRIGPGIYMVRATDRRRHAERKVLVLE